MIHHKFDGSDVHFMEMNFRIFLSAKFHFPTDSNNSLRRALDHRLVVYSNVPPVIAHNIPPILRSKASETVALRD